MGERRQTIFLDILYSENTKKYENLVQDTLKQCCAVEKNEIKGDCSICLEELVFSENNLIKLDCNHYFHEKCIEKWITDKNSCPLCRFKVFKEPAKFDPHSRSDFQELDNPEDLLVDDILSDVRENNYFFLRREYSVAEYYTEEDTDNLGDYNLGQYNDSDYEG
jgi:hypothetical protein